MGEAVETIVKYIKISEGLTQKARNVLYFKEAIRTCMREFMKEVAKNHAEAVKLWDEVKQEATKQGIELQKEEGFQFDFITDRFFIVKLQRENEK